ncbi:MAG TPA: TldD/PmbA family protein [Bacillota bacterium]|nr:MAG: protease TldD [Firmicutes bacterium ADurb.Bin153]HNV34754.1 TldD/PmbA family protein [Bacillota bacterium]HPU95357.1 TldD/PmbA family protein [Bacillota bacterium]
MDFRGIMADAISSYKGRADYLEVRIEQREATSLLYRLAEADSVSVKLVLGGSVRALADGGWGFAAFNDLAAVGKACEDAVTSARYVGSCLPASEKVSLARVTTAYDEVDLGISRGAKDVTLSDKMRVLGEYAQILAKSDPRVVSSHVRYGDFYVRKYFANSEGAYIVSEGSDMNASFGASAMKEGRPVEAFEGVGSTLDFTDLEGKHDVAREVVETCIETLDAEPVKAGVYTVVCDPHLAGVFIHEAFGHLSESDFIAENEDARKMMTLGRRFGQDFLNVADEPVPAGLRGSYKYDDEGTPAVTAPLITNGLLVGRLHSRETAAKMGEPTTGNARAVNHKFAPIVRMRNTVIRPGKADFDQLIGDIKLGIFAKAAYGGQTMIEQFSFSAREAFMIRDGKLAERVRDVVMAGNLFETLLNIEGIGSDFRWTGHTGGCGKGGQFPLPVMMGSPSIRIKNVVVGGR